MQMQGARARMRELSTCSPPVAGPDLSPERCQAFVGGTPTLQRPPLPRADLRQGSFAPGCDKCRKRLLVGMDRLHARA